MDYEDIKDGGEDRTEFFSCLSNFEDLDPTLTEISLLNNSTSSLVKEKPEDQVFYPISVDENENAAANLLTQTDVGSRVSFLGIKSGTLKFLGRTHFAEGIWCGIELDLPEGKHQGTIEGVEYFKSNPTHGIFAPVEKVQKLVTESATPYKEVKRENTFIIEEYQTKNKTITDSSTAKEEQIIPEPQMDPVAKRCKVPQYSNTNGKKSGSSVSSKKSNSKKRSGQLINSNSSVNPKAKSTSNRVLKKSLKGNAKETNYDADNDDDEEEEEKTSMDESLGILSPSDMRSGLPSLSTSIVSEFGWEKSSLADKDFLAHIHHNRNSSTSTPKQQLDFNGERESNNQHQTIKSFALDENKIKQIESITKGDQHIEVPVVKRPVAAAIKTSRIPLAPGRSDLVARTEKLLHSRSNPKPLDESKVIVKLQTLKREKNDSQLDSENNRLLNNNPNAPEISKVMKKSTNLNNRDLKKIHLNKPTVSDIDTGNGSSMPSSMISMSTSQDINSELDTSGIFSEAEQQNASKSLCKPNISPIEEKSEQEDKSMIRQESAVQDHSMEKTLFKSENKRKRCENGSSERSKPISKRSRSFSKDKEKGMATKRSELLSKNPVMPNTNVPSKLKTLLANPQNNVGNVRRGAKEKKAGKWEKISIMIKERQANEEKIDYTQVKSKFCADFKKPTKAFQRTDTECERNLPLSEPLLSRASSKSSMTSSKSFLSDISNNQKLQQINSMNSVDSTVNNNKKPKPTKVVNNKVNSNSNKSNNLPKKATPKVHRVLKKKPSDPKEISKPNKSNSNQNQPENESQSNPKLNHQPDLVQGVKSLESNTDGKWLEKLDEIAQCAKHNALGFEAVAVALSYLNNKDSSTDLASLESQPESSDLQMIIAELQGKLAEKEEELMTLSQSHETDLKQISLETSKYKEDKDSVIDQYNKMILVLKREHKAQLNQVKLTHKNELDSLNQSRIQDLTQQDQRHELEVSGIQRECQDRIADITEKFEQKLLESLEQRQEILTEKDNQFAVKEEKWIEAKKSLENKIRNLQSEVNEQADMARAKNAGELRLQKASKKLEESCAEIESLKAVLEMKTEEVRSLRKDNVRLEQKLEEFDQINLELKKVTAQVEDLKAQIATKNNLERHLSAENRKLSLSVEKEVSEKRRLTRENEQLLWKFKQSTENLCATSMLEPGCFSTPISSNSHQPLSISFSEGCCRSLPPLTGRVKKTSEDNFDISSPQLLEVVEKEESVSWKIQYEDQSSSLNQSNPSCDQSPVLKRKVSPSSGYLEDEVFKCPVVRSTSVRVIPPPIFEPLSEEEPSLVEDLDASHSNPGEQEQSPMPFCVTPENEDGKDPSDSVDENEQKSRDEEDLREPAHNEVTGESNSEDTALAVMDHVDIHVNEELETRSFELGAQDEKMGADLDPPIEEIYLNKSEMDPEVDISKQEVEPQVEAVQTSIQHEHDVTTV